MGRSAIRGATEKAARFAQSALPNGIFRRYIRGILRCNSRRSDGLGWFALVYAIALAVEAADDLVWFWIGSHADYGAFIR
jgi:hypothetical protein